MIETTKPEEKATAPATLPAITPNETKPEAAAGKKPAAPAKKKPTGPAEQKAKKTPAKKAAKPSGKAKPAGAAQKPAGGVPAGKPPKKPIFRPDSVFALAFERLKTGKEFDIMSLFGGLKKSNGAVVPVADPARVLQHIMKRGEFSGQFRVERLKNAKGMVKMTKLPKE